MKYSYPTGSMWEDYDWHIETNCGVSLDGARVCKHCHSPTTEQHKAFDGTLYTREVCTCPRVVIAYNEGGHATTGVCLDCILEAAAVL